MLRDASMDPIFCHFHRPCARHCHLERSVRLAFRLFQVERALTESFTTPLKVVEASRVGSSLLFTTMFSLIF